MVSSSYTPGTWLGVVRSGTAVLLAPATPPALVDSLWELLAREPEVHEVLHAVTSASSGSLAQIPWFGIVEFRDSLRVFLRGDIELTAQLAAGPVELNGSDVTTWTERRLSAPESYKVSVPGDPAGAAELPLGEGVVLLQSLTVGHVAAALPPMPETNRKRPERKRAGRRKSNALKCPSRKSRCAYPSRTSRRRSHSLRCRRPWHRWNPRKRL